jgi:DNA repair protein RadC
MKTYKSTISLFSLKKNSTDFKKVKIGSSKDAFDYISNFYGDDLEIYESFFVLLLNRNNTTIGYAKISQGGISGTVVDSRIIAKYCIDALASAVILSHNHPSGNLRPSSNDLDITKKITNVLALLDCKVLDHLILGGDTYLSLADEGFIS